jgi:hemerythrin-like domain-containing protein
MHGPNALSLFRMPRFTDNLRADHLVVRTALAVLGAVGDHVRNGGDLPVEDSAALLRFLREFLLATHFRKESDLVWPAVAMRCDERAASLVGELLRLQEEVTELVHTLVLFWEPVGELTPAERDGFANTIGACSTRLLRMMELEEREVFRCCDAIVPADDQLDWADAFAHLEGERTPRDAWVRELRALQKKWPA